MTQDTDYTDYITNPEDMAALKADRAANATGSWHANLWGNVPQAINWANTIPVSPAGAIVFNIRDNGQVWTYTLF